MASPRAFMPSPPRAKPGDSDLNVLEEQTRVWLSLVLNETLSMEIPLAELLADGKLLLSVARKIYKETGQSLDSVVKSEEKLKEEGEPGKWNLLRTKSLDKPVTVKSGSWTAWANVNNFLEVCKAFGLSDVDLFTASDAVEGKNLKRVYLCLRALSRKAREKDLPIYDFNTGLLEAVKPLSPKVPEEGISPNWPSPSTVMRLLDMDELPEGLGGGKKLGIKVETEHTSDFDFQETLEQMKRRGDRVVVLGSSYKNTRRKEGDQVSPKFPKVVFPASEGENAEQKTTEGGEEPKKEDTDSSVPDIWETQEGNGDSNPGSTVNTETVPNEELEIIEEAQTEASRLASYYREKWRAKASVKKEISENTQKPILHISVSKSVEPVSTLKPEDVGEGKQPVGGDSKKVKGKRAGGLPLSPKKEGSPEKEGTHWGRVREMGASLVENLMGSGGRDSSSDSPSVEVNEGSGKVSKETLTETRDLEKERFPVKNLGENGKNDSQCQVNDEENPKSGKGVVVSEGKKSSDEIKPVTILKENGKETQVKETSVSAPERKTSGSLVRQNSKNLVKLGSSNGVSLNNTDSRVSFEYWNKNPEEQNRRISEGASRPSENGAILGGTEIPECTIVVSQGLAGVSEKTGENQNEKDKIIDVFISGLATEEKRTGQVTWENQEVATLVGECQSFITHLEKLEKWASIDEEQNTGGRVRAHFKPDSLAIVLGELQEVKTKLKDIEQKLSIFGEESPRERLFGFIPLPRSSKSRDSLSRESLSKSKSKSSLKSNSSSNSKSEGNDIGPVEQLMQALKDVMEGPKESNLEELGLVRPPAGGRQMLIFGG